jgi:hypothetical protein
MVGGERESVCGGGAEWYLRARARTRSFLCVYKEKCSTVVVTLVHDAMLQDALLYLLR